MKKILLSLTVLLVSAVIFSQPLTDTEKKIISYINLHIPDAENLLIETVNINSGTLNVAGVKEVGDIFRRELEKTGFITEWIAVPDSLKRAGHLVATRKGNRGKKLFIIGHLDTVFELDMPFSPYTKLNDSTATGQGVNDMKGGDVVAVIALQALQSMHLLDDASIIVYFAGDEEKSGRPISVGRKDFIERARTCDVALAFEGASGLNTVATGRRGISGWQLDVTAKTGHSAGIFAGGGYGAIYETARILNEFRVQMGHEKYLTFNPGIIIGGSEIKYDVKNERGEASGKTNIISPAVSVAGDLRFLSINQREAARKKMRNIVEKNNLNGTKAMISFEEGIPAMEPTAGNDALVTKIDGISKALGIGPTKAGDPGSRGAGDISYVAGYMDGIDGLGASGSGAHAAGETINLKQLPLLIQRAAILIYRLTR